MKISLIFSCLIVMVVSKGKKILILECLKLSNSGGGASTNVVGIICPPDWNRVNWSAKLWRGVHPPPPPPTLFRHPCSLSTEVIYFHCNCQQNSAKFWSEKLHCNKNSDPKSRLGRLLKEFWSYLFGCQIHNKNKTQMTSDFIKNMTHIETRIPIGKTKKLIF